MYSEFKKYRCRGLLLICFFLAFAYLAAQTPVTYIGINQGLSNNSVRCILRDHKGFMWFGTFDGLNRYDGYSFRVFRNKVNDSTSLINPFIYALNEDHEGRLWIGTRRGLSIYNSLTDKFIHLSHAQNGKVSIVSDVIKGIATDSLHNMFVGTENTGLLLCKNSSAIARHISLNSEISFGVQAIKTGPVNKVWVFVQNRGLCLFDHASMSLRLVDSTVQSATSMEIDGRDIWIGTTKGLYRFNTITFACTIVEEVRPGSERISTLTLDKNRNLWIGTIGAGITIWNLLSGKTEYLEQGDSKYSLLSGDIYTIYEDGEARKWIGTQKGGVNILDPKKKRFRIIAHDPGIAGGFAGNSVSAFYETNESSLWIGTDDAGVNIWDRKLNRFSNLRYIEGNERSLPSNVITDIEPDEFNNAIWIGTFTSGLFRVQPQERSGKRYRCINPVSGLENPVVYLLYRDSLKTLWVTTLRQGNHYGALYYYNRTFDRFDAFDTNLSDLFAINEDRQGNLWGGNLNQLVKIDRVHKQHRFFTMDYPVRAVYESRKGDFWVATDGGGLILFDRRQNKIASRYTTEDGLCNNSILNILEDEKGNLWMSTLNGLSRFDPEKKSFNNYYYNDGLQSNQFNYNAALALRTGEFVFGGIKGFNLFRPEQIVDPVGAPPIVITGIKVNNTAVNANSPYVTKAGEGVISQLKIPYNEAALSLEFAALEYSVPEKISYTYYLEGWDRRWNDTGNLRIANYTRLSEGIYNFRVKNSNAEGEWGSSETAISIIVLPPWYRTWWAYLLYAITAGLLIYIFWLYRMRQTRLKFEIALANVSIEKEKELNKKRLDFFTGVTHEFRTPLTLIINPVKDLLQKNRQENAGLSIVYRNARRMLSLVDQLLFFQKADTGIDRVKPGRLDFYSFCHEVYLCFVQQAKAKNILYEFVCYNTDLEMYVDREKMEIVLYNLLSNAIKYTAENGAITFKLADAGDELEISVTDNGTGIPPEAGDKLFEKFYQVNGGGAQSKPGFGIGLYLVRQFVEAHKGRVSYTSTLGKGTTFNVFIKKGKEHFDAALISDEMPLQTAFPNELHDADDDTLTEDAENKKSDLLQPIVTSKQVMLVVDDDLDIRRYIAGIFGEQFTVYEAGSGKKGLKLAEKYFPDIIISDIKMEEGDGIALCREIKNHASLSHIPVILLTGSQSSDIRLEGVEGGADDYITKPFEKELLMARVANLQKTRANLQKYFFDEITLNKHDLKISEEYKEFLERCIAIVEAHLDDEEFTIAKLAAEMGMSYSSVYKKVRTISGQSLKGFVRFIRLRKAAELFINTNLNVSEVAFQVGIYDAKFFREQFNKLFGMNPSGYIKKYRKPFQGQYTINPKGKQ
jgi:signal transduction histidine kinase/ligand-binding sensor domain-containing protein/DNA-binding response OmpR family regulator